jgi:hypothetical protein
LGLPLLRHFFKLLTSCTRKLASWFQSGASHLIQGGIPQLDSLSVNNYAIFLHQTHPQRVKTCQHQRCSEFTVGSAGVPQAGAPEMFPALAPRFK